MSDSPVSYTLSAKVVEYSRKTGPCSSLLFSLGQKALAIEEAGGAIEEVHGHLTADGDYRGLLIVDMGGA